MLDYLYYRFYRLWLHSSIAEAAVFMAVALLGVLLSSNLLTVWALLDKNGILEFPTKTEYLVVLGCIVLLHSLYLFPKGRYKKIITRYEDENSMQRKVGSIILTLYIVLTYAIFIFVAFYRAGKI